MRPHLWHGGHAACLSPFRHARIVGEIVLMTLSTLCTVRCSLKFVGELWQAATTKRCQAGREQTTWHVMRPSVPTVGAPS